MNPPAQDAAAAAPWLLSLRPTLLSDLDYVMAVERDQHAAPFISPWERTQHEGALRFPDLRHFIVEVRADNNQPAVRDGFVIVQGCRNPNRSVELKRLVLQTQGRGRGRLCLRLLKRMAFRDLHAHRCWLEVRSANTRAVALYLSEGFVEEGRLRESVRLHDADADAETGSGSDVVRYDSMVVMALLDREYLNRVALGLDPAA